MRILDKMELSLIEGGCSETPPEVPDCPPPPVCEPPPCEPICFPVCGPGHHHHHHRRGYRGESEFSIEVSINIRGNSSHNYERIGHSHW
jgi:hypothetical protein